MPETFENWFGHVNRYVWYAHRTREIYHVLPYAVDLKAPGELWNLLSETVLSECSFNGNKRPVYI